MLQLLDRLVRMGNVSNADRTLTLEGFSFGRFIVDTHYLRSSFDSRKSLARISGFCFL